METENATTELTISLPESMKDFIERETAEGHYATPSEYVRDLVEEALDRKNEERLEKLLLEGLDSGTATPMTREDWDGIKQRGLERIQRKQA
ncbi:MAG: ribbon-helix-helix domain-containing protein [Acidobacteriota bacterium]